MPNSFNDVTGDWTGLNESVLLSPDLQSVLDTERLTLVQWLETVHALKARQDELRGLRQEVTQQLHAALTQGKEVAIRVRSMIRAKIGPKNERLVQFKVAPIRKRPRKPVKPPDGETPETSISGTTASPPDQQVP